MVRKGGLEPPRSCDRQPLKLVRLPIPPLPHEGQLSVVSSQFSDLSRQSTNVRPFSSQLPFVSPRSGRALKRGSYRLLTTDD